VAQFSVLGGLQLEAQQNAVRALGYDLHQPCYLIAENQIEKLGAPKLVILPSAQALRESTWQTLLAYVKSGGNLLVSGPLSRDEHWHLVDRLTPLGIHGKLKPLTFHTASLALRAEYKPLSNLLVAPIDLSFEQQKQKHLEYLDFSELSTVLSLRLEKGRLFWAAYPVELSEGSRATSAFYETILHFLDFKPLFAGQVPPPTGVLAYRLDLQDAVLYVLESELDYSQLDQGVDLNFQDSLTGAPLKLALHSQHAALALIDKHSKQIVAHYGF
jgi:hypothetical protein